MEHPDNEPDGSASVNAVKEGEFRFALREAGPADLDFVADSWRRSYDLNGANPLTRCPGGVDEYIRTQREVIETCLDRSKVLVAHPECPQRRPEQILGWVCYRPPSTVHYVYVKAPFRRIGIGWTLVSQACDHFVATGNRFYTSHSWRRRGLACEALVNKFPREAILDFNPALIFGEIYDPE